MRVELTVEVVREDGDSEIEWEAAMYALARAMAERDEAPSTARFVESMGLDVEVEQ